jgi:hypothetical protein
MFGINQRKATVFMLHYVPHKPYSQGLEDIARITMMYANQVLPYREVPVVFFKRFFLKEYSSMRSDYKELYQIGDV